MSPSSFDSTIARTAGGIRFAGALALLFIGAKLFGAIGWHWGWVLSPLWAPYALILGAYGVGVAASWPWPARSSWPAPSSRSPRDSSSGSGGSAIDPVPAHRL